MLNHNIHTHKSNKGFTLVELLIVAPIVILVIGGFITVIVTMTGNILASRGSNELIYNIQDALSRIEQDVKTSGAYLAINNITLTSPQGYDNNMAAFNNVTTDTSIGPMLILNAYTTTANPTSSVRNIVYKNSPNACNGDTTNQNPPLMMNVVYFVKDNSLWRRTLANSNYNTIGCSVTTPSSVPWQQPSCYPGASGTLCKAKDIKLIDGISPTDGFKIDYYTDINTNTKSADATDTSKNATQRLAGLQLVKAAKVTIKATSTVSGHDITQSSSIVVASPNNNTTN